MFTNPVSLLRAEINPNFASASKKKRYRFCMHCVPFIFCAVINLQLSLPVIERVVTVFQGILFFVVVHFVLCSSSMSGNLVPRAFSIQPRT